MFERIKRCTAFILLEIESVRLYRSIITNIWVTRVALDQNSPPEEQIDIRFVVQLMNRLIRPLMDVEITANSQGHVVTGCKFNRLFETHHIKTMAVTFQSHVSSKINLNKFYVQLFEPVVL